MIENNNLFNFNTRDTMADDTTSEWHFKIPCSSANVGPGFDVLGVALDLYMR
jgi:hypothetical protein